MHKHLDREPSSTLPVKDTLVSMNLIKANLQKKNLQACKQDDV